MRRLPAVFNKLRGRSSHSVVNIETPPTVAWLIEHRVERQGKPALTQGSTPTASLYRMYEYLVTGFIIGLRSEIEHFYNQALWKVSSIPDPKDPEPDRYAILSVLTFYLVTAFNRLSERGLPRGSPAIISAEEEEELRKQPVVLEEEPSWVATVPKLEHILVIPGASGKDPEVECRSARLAALNIIAEEPHVLFV